MTPFGWLTTVAAALAAATFPATVAAQALAPPPLGAWTGTSLCLQGKPVCKDERVVYHGERSAPDSAGVTPLRVAMNKVVGGHEEEMGVLECRYARADATLRCQMPPQFPRGEWRFRRRGDTLVGGLWLEARGQFREVRLRRRPS